MSQLDINLGKIIVGPWVTLPGDSSGFEYCYIRSKRAGKLTAYVRVEVEPNAHKAARQEAIDSGLEQLKHMVAKADK